jgi:autotransporter-associated beta strand protein
VGNNNISGGITTASTTTTRLGSGFGMMSVNGLALGAGQTTIITGNLIANSTLTGVSGTGTLQKQGTSTLILTGSNTNTGIVDLNGGFVRVSSAANLGTSTAANAISHNNSTLEVRTDAPDFNTKGMSLANNNGTVNLDRAVGGSGLGQTVTFANLTVAANRNITFNSRNGYGAQFAALVGGAAGQNTVTNNGNGAVVFTGNVWGNSDGTARVLTLAAANVNSAIVINGNITAPNTAAHNVAKTGAGTLTVLGTASTYSGQTDIQNGTLTARNWRSIGHGTVGANVLLGNAGNTGTLSFIGADGSGAVATPSIARNIILNGTTGGGRINANQTGSAPTALVLAGTITSSNTGTQAKTLTLGGSSGLDNEISGAISANTADTVNLTKVDSGTWVLSGSNTYNGTTTVTNGSLKLRANAAASTIVNDASGLTFNVEAATQAAGGNLTFVGQASTANVETMGVLTPTQGAGSITLSPGGAGTASMVFSSLGGTASSIAGSINIIAPTASDTVTISAQPTGFVRSNVYYNGGNFAYSAGGVLRAPLYGDGVGGGGTDIGFLTTAAGPLGAALHNEITGSFAQATTTIGSLKISGSQTLTLSGLLGIQTGSSTAGGILLSGAGATATITGGSISQGSGAVVNGGAGLNVRVDDATSSLTLQSPITNSTIGGLTKNGAGTLILRSAAHAYGGGTTINEGTLQLFGTTTVMGGANGVTTIRQGATLDLNAVSTGTRIGLLQGAGTITNTGSAASVLTVGNGNGAGVWTGTILQGNGMSVIKQGTGSPTWSGASTYTGPTTINSTGIISVPNLASIGTASGIGAGTAANNAGSLLFSGASTAGASGGISYTGNSSISIDRLFTFANDNTNRAVATTGGVSSAGARIQANGANNATLVFNNPGAAVYTAGANTVAQTLTLGGASTGDNTMNVALVNPTGPTATLSVLKADAGTWVLTGANTYTGSTAVSGGRLVAIDGAGLPSGSPLVLGSGVFQSTGSFTRALAASPTFGVGTVTWSGNTGAAAAGFAADSSKFTVNIGPGSSLTWGSGGFAMPIGTAAANATLLLNSITALAEVEFQNDIALGAVNRTVQVDDNTTTTTDFATLSGVLSGATSGTAGSGIVKTGAGALQLLGDNTYQGATLLSAGSLYVRSFGGSATSASNLGGSSAVLRLGGGTLVYAGPGESSDRAVALNAGTVLDASGSGALVLNGSFSFPGSVARTLALQGFNTDANEIASTLTNVVNGTGLVSVTKSGGGTWILSAANTHGGTTTVTSGALGIGNNAALGTGTLTLQNGSIFADGADRTITNLLNMNNATGAVIGVNSLTVNGPAQFNGGNFTLNNFIAAGEQFEITGTLTNSDAGTARTFAVGGTGRSVFSGTIQEAGTAAASFTVNGGTVILQAAGGNTYSGNSTFNGGTVQLAGGSGNLIPDGAGKGNVVFSNGAVAATLDLNGQTETINGLTAAGTGVRTIDNSSATAVTLTIGNNNGPVNFVSSAAGGITQTGAGALSLVKVGTAAGVLNIANAAINGTIDVQGGSLSFNNAQPNGATGITVAGGSGLAFNNGLGQAISALTLLNLGGGAGTTTLGLDLGTTSDTLTTSGAATTANTILFDLIGVSGFGAGTYDLLLATGGLFGPTYGLSSVPGGFSYMLDIDPLGTFVRLNATALGPQTFYWTQDQDASWSTFNLGNTNWADAAGVEIGSTPGPLDTVIFSATSSASATLPAGPIITTTLDGNFTVNDIVFNGATSTAAAGGASVRIAAGSPASSTLTIAPSSSTTGITVPDNAGLNAPLNVALASIGAPLILGADQTWSISSVGNAVPGLIVTGIISGTGNMTKTGSGTATITGNNTQTGKTDIAAGTLNINAEAALGAAPGSTVADQLSISGTLRAAGNITLSPTRGVTLGVAGGTFDTVGNTITVNGKVTGGSVIKLGTGTLILNNAANDYGASTTIINAGIVRAGATGALGAGDVQLNNSGTVLELADGVTVGNPIDISNTGNEKTLRLLTGATTGEISGPIAVAETTGGNFRVSAAAGGTLTISGAITTQTGTTASGIRKEGAGVVVLSGANAMNGPSSVAAGTLRHGANSVLASTTAVTIHGTGGVAATLDLNNFNQTVGSVTFNAGGGAAGSVNSITTGTGTLALGGNVTVNNNGNPTTPASISGLLSLNGNRTFNVGNSTGSATDLLISAVISNGSVAAANLLKTGAGTLQLTGTNTYTGISSIQNGVLQHGANDVLVATADVRVNANSTNPATFDLNGFNQTIGSLTFGGNAGVAGSVNSVTTGVGLLTLGGNVTVNANGNPTTPASISGNVDLPANRTFTVNDSTGSVVDLSVSAVVSGTGGLTKAGTGTMELSGANTYSGITIVNAGTLRNGANDVIPGAIVVNATAASGTATYDTNGLNETVPGITYGGSTAANTTNNVTSGAGTLALNGDVTVASVGAGGPAVATLGGTVFLGSVSRTFTVANTTNAQADLMVSATLFGPGHGIVKEGLGTMEITGTNTYAGPTVINAGTFLVTGSASASAFTVNTGGTLGGAGTVGSVDVNTGGSVAPGASIGTLSAGALTLNGNAAFQLEINTSNLTTDLLNSSGALSLDLANTALLAITDLGGNVAVPLNTKFTFITYNGTWNGGLFTVGGTPILDDVDNFQLGANVFAIDYNDGGNSVSLIAVPEPGIAVSVLGGLGLLVGLQRRPRRRHPAR